MLPYGIGARGEKRPDKTETAIESDDKVQRGKSIRILRVHVHPIAGAEQIVGDLESLVDDADDERRRAVRLRTSDTLQVEIHVRRVLDEFAKKPAVCLSDLVSAHQTQREGCVDCARSTQYRW